MINRTEMYYTLCYYEMQVAYISLNCTPNFISYLTEKTLRLH